MSSLNGYTDKNRRRTFRYSIDAQGLFEGVQNQRDLEIRFLEKRFSIQQRNDEK